MRKLEEAFGLYSSQQQSCEFLGSSLQFPALGVASFIVQKTRGVQNLLSPAPKSCVDFICVCLRGRAEFSSALEILFPREKGRQKMVFAPSKKKKKGKELLLNVPSCLIFFLRGFCQVTVPGWIARRTVRAGPLPAISTLLCLFAPNS